MVLTDSWDTAQQKEAEFFLQCIDSYISQKLWVTYINQNSFVLPQLSSEMFLLDVCSGPVSILHVLPQTKRMVALDSLNDKYAAKFERLKYVEYISHEAEKLPFDDDSFDVVFCINALDHTRNWEDVLSEISRVLCKNGQLYLDFEQTNYMEDFFTKIGWKKHLKEHHLHSLTFSEVVKIIGKTGKFEVNEVQFEKPLTWEKIKVAIFSIFSPQKLERRPQWEKKISSLNLPWKRRLIYFFILFLNSIGFLISPKYHAYFVKVLLIKK